MNTKINKEKIALAHARLKVLSRSKSLSIIKMLEENETLMVTIIQTKLKVDQPTASYYLINMKRKGLLNSTRAGSKILYSLNKDVIERTLSLAEMCIAK